MPAPTFSAGDYTISFLSLLPHGPIWPRDADQLPYQVAQALMQSYERSNASAANLLVDAFPATSRQLLPEWERTLGLTPASTSTGLDETIGDDIEIGGTDVTIGDATGTRQGNVVAQLIDNGGCSAAYYKQIAAALGFTITIKTYAAFRFGRNHFGDPMAGAAWFSAWSYTIVSGPADPTLTAALAIALQTRAQADVIVILAADVLTDDNGNPVEDDSGASITDDTQSP